MRFIPGRTLALLAGALLAAPALVPADTRAGKADARTKGDATGKRLLGLHLQDAHP